MWPRKPAQTFTSPRLRGEVGAKRRVRGPSAHSVSVEAALSEAIPHAVTFSRVALPPPRPGLRSAVAGCCAARMRKALAAQNSRHGRRQARQDHRRARPLRDPGSGKAARAGAAGDRARRRRGGDRARPAARRDGCAGGRHRGAVDQSELVQGRPRAGGADRQDPERKTRRALRLEAGSLCRLRLADPAGAGSRGAGARRPR